MVIFSSFSSANFGTGFAPVNPDFVWHVWDGYLELLETKITGLVFVVVEMLTEEFGVVSGEGDAKVGIESKGPGVGDGAGIIRHWFLQLV